MKSVVIMKDKIGNDILEFCQDEKNISFVKYQGNEYANLLKFFHSYKEITSQPDLASKIINFFMQGLRFAVIFYPEEFKKNYLNKTKTFGSFNVDEITIPILQGAQLIFYAEDLETGVPYKVTFILPENDSVKPHCNYQLLSQKN